MRSWPAWVNWVVLPVAILVFYFIVPVGTNDAPAGEVLGLAIGAIAVLTVASVIFAEVQRAEKRLRPVHLLLAFEMVLVTFSLGYYLLAHSNPDQFIGLNTRMDALYFSMVTMSTVGYGDITAHGQLARVMVTSQLAFNLAFVGALVALLQEQFRSGVRRRKPRAEHHTGRHEHDHHDG